MVIQLRMKGFLGHAIESMKHPEQTITVAVDLIPRTSWFEKKGYIIDLLHYGDVRLCKC